jgi:hypothetical protein
MKREQCGKECSKEMRWLLEVEGGWKTGRTYVAGSGLKAETDEPCHD